MTLYAAELNVVLQRKLWPRSLIGPPVEAADQKALTDRAKVEERHDEEIVEVRFDPQAGDSQADAQKDGRAEAARTGDPPPRA
jgi:hypothetical protein